VDQLNNWAVTTKFSRKAIAIALNAVISAVLGAKRPAVMRPWLKLHTVLKLNLADILSLKGFGPKGQEVLLVFARENDLHFADEFEAHYFEWAESPSVDKRFSERARVSACGWINFAVYNRRCYLSRAIGPHTRAEAQAIRKDLVEGQHRGLGPITKQVIEAYFTETDAIAV
jgi:hypothetical protein